MSIVRDNQDKTWIVYLLDGKEIPVTAHYIDDYKDGKIYFRMGDDDILAVTVAKFLEANIAGYKLVRGKVVYGGSPLKSQEAE